MRFPFVDLDKWREKVRRELKNEHVDPFLWREQLEGLIVKAVYTSEDRAEMSTTRPEGDGRWIRSQLFCQPQPEMLKQALQEAAKADCSGIWLRLDQSVRRGGKPAGDGALLWGIPAWKRAFSEIPLADACIQFDGGGNTFASAATFAGFLAEQEIDCSAVQINWGLDPIGALAKDGKLAHGIKWAFSEAQRLLRWATSEKHSVFCFSAAPYHMAGADAATELALLLAVMADSFQRMVELGVSPQVLASKMSLAVPVDRNVFVNIVKLRALRRLTEAFFTAWGVESSISIHAHTSERMLSQRDPWVNILRATTSAFASIVGGADRISILPYDHLHGSSELGRRIACNTHLILDAECQLSNTVDPAAGSFYLEYQTEQLCEKAWRTFQSIEEKGGFVHELLSGRLLQMLREQQNKRTISFRYRRSLMTGVSSFPDKQKIVSNRPNISDITQQEEIYLQGYYQQRGEGPTIGGSGFSSMIRLIRSGATTQELAAGMSLLDPVMTLPLLAVRDAQQFEELRDRADRLSNVKVHLFGLGTIAQAKPVMDFAQDFFAVGGVEAIVRLPVDDEQDLQTLVASLPDGQVSFSCLCGSTASYEMYAKRLMDVLGGVANHYILFAGRREQCSNPEQIWSFVSRESDVYEVLNAMLEELENEA